jgi:hypothetical protein
MRRAVRSLLFAGLIAFVAPASVSAATCAPGPHRETVVARPSVVVIHDTTTHGNPDQLCDKATGRRTDLDFPVTVFGGGGTPDHVARHSLVVVGSRIAYAFDDNDGTSGFSGIAVADARTGEKRLPAFQNGGHYSRFSRIVLTRRGSVAWSEHGQIGYIKTCDRRCVESDRRQSTTLAKGARVAWDTLRGVRSGIAWRQAGRTRYARFS